MAGNRSKRAAEDKLPSTAALELLNELNQASILCKRSSASKTQVLQIFGGSVARLGLTGVVCLFSTGRSHLLLSAILGSSPTFLRLQSWISSGLAGYSFPVEQANHIREVIASEQGHFAGDAAAVLSQILADRERIWSRRLLREWRRQPVITVPLWSSTSIAGVLHLAGGGLTRADIPVVQAFANGFWQCLVPAEEVETLASNSLRDAPASFYEIHPAGGRYAGEQPECQGKNAKKQTYGEENIFRSIVEQSIDGILVVDEQGSIIGWNQAMELTTGLTAAEVLGQPVWDVQYQLMPPKNRCLSVYQELKASFRDFLRTGQSPWLSRLNEYDIYTRYNGQRSIQAVFFPLHSDKGYKTCTISRDITERKQMEQALRRQAEELAALHAVSLTITAAQELPLLLQTIVAQATHLLGGTGGTFYLCRPELREVHCEISYCTRRDYTGTVVPYGEGVVGQTALTGKPLLISDYRTSPSRSSRYEHEQPFRSVVSAPVIWKGRVTGVILVLHDEEISFFTPAGLELLTLFANQAAIAIENTRLLEAERRRRREAETLRRASESLTSTLDLHQVIEDILVQLEKVVPYDSASVFLLDGSKLRIMAARGLENPAGIVGQTFNENDQLFKSVERSARPLILEDARSDPRYHGWGGTDYVRGWMGIPMILHGKVRGYLTCDSRQPKAYHAADADLAEAFANQAIVAIENARLFKAAQDQLLLAKTLQEVGALLTSQLSLPEVLDNILDLLGRVVHYDSASIQLLDANNVLDLAAGRGFDDLDKTRAIIRTISREALMERWPDQRAVAIPDTHQDPAWINKPGSEHIRSWIGAPLLVRGRLIGCVNIDSVTPGQYSAATADTAMTFAHQAAIAIENARLFEAERSARSRSDALRDAAREISSTLALDEVLSAVLEQLARVLNYDSGSIMLLDDEQVYIKAGHGYNAFVDKHQVEKINFSVESNPIIRQVVREDKVVVVSDTSQAPGWEFTEVGRGTRSWLGVPLKGREKVIGLLGVDRVETGGFDAGEVDLAQAFATQVSMIIENARLFQQAETERRHLGLLYDLSRETGASLDPDEILDRVLTLTCRTLGGDLGEAFLYIPEENRLSLRSLYGQEVASLPALDRRLNMFPGRGLAGWAALQNEPVYVSDLRQDKHIVLLDGITDDLKSAMSGPILTGDRLLGVLTVFYSHPNALSTGHLNLLQAICQEVGLALSNARRYQQLQRRLKEMTVLQSLTQSITQRLEHQALLREVADQLAHQIGYPQVGIYLVEDDTLVMRAYYGTEPAQSCVSIQEGIIGRVARTGQFALVTDVSLDPDYQAFIPGMAAELAVPIYGGKVVVGVISVYSDRADLLGEQDCALLQVLAGQVSVALENAYLYERLRRHVEDLEGMVKQRTAELSELYSLSQEIGYQLSFDSLLKLLLRHTRSAIRCDLACGFLAASGYLATSDRQTLMIHTDHPLAKGIAAELDARLHTIQMQFAAGPVESLNPPVEILHTTAFRKSNPEIQRLGSVISAPILADDQLLGVLIAASEQPGFFSAEHQRLLTTFANQAAAAVQRLAAVLTAQQQHLENLVAHLPVGVLLCDTEFRLLVANPLGRQILSILCEEGLSGGPLTRLGDYPLEQLIQRQDPLLPFEIIINGPPHRFFSTQISPVDEDKRQWVLMVREVTQERENQARIQSQERLATVGQLAAGIAHDFNNIMAAILVYSDLLGHDPHLTQNSREKLNIIQLQVQRASSLIRQILDFSRRSIIEQSPLDLLPFIKELDRMLARVLPETIRLELTYQPGAYWVSADPTRIQQVFMNLAVNARDAMPHGGILNFELSRLWLGPGQTPPLPQMPEIEWVKVAVTDTGTGIPPEIIEHIFEPFFTTKPVGEGSGLGLAQVYGIIKQHEGFIDVHSEPGKGTSFIIYLPAINLREESQLEEALQHLDGNNETILVVEDDAVTRDAMRALLEAYNYQVLVAANGVEALRHCEQAAGEIALIISDIVMPQMGGLSLYEALQEEWPDIKVLFVTGHPLEGDNQALLEQGNVNWLQKPFSVQQFSQVVRSLLDGKR